MINHLTGNITDTGKDFVVIECGGIGFRLVATTTTIATVESGQADVTILTHLQLREGGADLYGFASETEREIFHALTGVAGVGPKSGMAVLSALGADGVIGAAMRGDEKLFGSVTGIGKKLAQRMISELPDRLKKSNLQPGSVTEGAQGAVSKSASGAVSESVDALVSLGFPQSEAHDAVIHEMKSSPEPLGSETLIKKALAHLYGHSRRISGKDGPR